MPNLEAIIIAHGVLACVAWVIFFPLGATLIRMVGGPSTWKVHASVQMVSMAIFTAAVGLGLKTATTIHRLDRYHAIIGLVVFVLMFAQASGGWAHHAMFKKHQSRTLVSHLHLWLGRSLITLAIINGGFGLQLNRHVTKGPKIAYGVVAALVWITWLSISVMGERRRRDETMHRVRQEKSSSVVAIEIEQANGAWKESRGR